MSNERSPRFPSDNLAESIRRLEALYNQAKRGAVDAETAAIAIGYGGLNGASKTTLAGMSYYGLIEREGHMQKVSEEGFKIIRPMDDLSKREAIRTAAFRPRVFAEIRETHADSSESVLARVLMHSGFTEEGAGRAARVYKENVAFLEQMGDTFTTEAARPEAKPEEIPPKEEAAKGSLLPLLGKMLAQYQIPLGSNQRQLTFTGEELVPEDFDALIDYVEIFKKQFVRASKAAPQPVAPPAPPQTGHQVMTFDSRPAHGQRTFPAMAVWKNKDHDVPVTITSVAGERDGMKFYQSSTGTGIPENELTFA